MGDPKPYPDRKGAKLRLKCLELYGQYEAHHVCLDCESENAKEVAIRTRVEFTTNYPHGREVPRFPAGSAMHRIGSDPPDLPLGSA